MLLQLSTSSPGTSFEFRLYGPEVNQLLPTDGVSDGAQVDFGIGQPTTVYGLAGTRSANAGLLVFSTKLPSLGETFEISDFDPAFLEQSSQMAFTAGSHRIVLHTGRPREALKAMSDCAYALVARWGLDPKVQANLSKPAAPTDKALFQRKIQEHYPTSQAFARKGGHVHLVALLDSKGNVTNCFVPNSIGDSEFGEAACKVVRKMQFTPAQDQNGAPIASFYGVNITYATI